MSETDPKTSSTGPRQGRDPGRMLAWGLLALAVLFAVAVRLRLLPVPFERDEGEYAYAGQLILQGVPPYRLVYNMKLPGTYLGYALIMALFGQTVEGVRLGLLLLNAATTALLVLLARRLFGGYVGALAGASYALLSLSPSVLGPFAHATHFVLLPALAGLLLLLRAIDSGRPTAFLWSGVLLGLGFVMKQHGLFLVLFGMFHLTWSWAGVWDQPPGDLDGREKSARAAGWRRVLIEGGLFSLGAALPYFATFLIMAASGVFGSFWFWTVEYARNYVSEVPSEVFLYDVPLVLSAVIGPNLPIWTLAAAGLFFLFRGAEMAGRRVFLAGLLTFTFLSVVPGYWLRPHYFVLVLPAIAILAGVGIDALRRLFVKTRMADLAALGGALLFLAAALAVIYPQAPFFFDMNPTDLSHEIYGDNPFPEAVEIGAYLRAHSTSEDRVAVLGSEPEIFFYANRRSATGHVYMYGLMERQSYARRMQEEAIREIEAARPRYMVLVNLSVSWLLWDHSDHLIIDWAEKYAKENYRIVGLVEFRPDGHASYTWGPEADRAPRFHDHIYIFERNRPAS